MCEVDYLWVAACNLGRVPVPAFLAPNAFQQQGEKAAITLKGASKSGAPPGSPVLCLLLLVKLARSIHSCEVGRAPWQRSYLFVWNVPSLSSPPKATWESAIDFHFSKLTSDPQKRFDVPWLLAARWAKGNLQASVVWSHSFTWFGAKGRVFRLNAVCVLVHNKRATNGYSPIRSCFKGVGCCQQPWFQLWTIKHL